MAYAGRGTQGGATSNPHGLHVNKVPQVPLSSMGYAQPTGELITAANQVPQSLLSSMGYSDLTGELDTAL